MGWRLLPVATARAASTKAIEGKKRNIIITCRTSGFTSGLEKKKDLIRRVFEKPSVVPICGMTERRKGINYGGSINERFIIFLLCLM